MTLTHKIYEDLFVSSDQNKQQISKRYDIEKQYLIFAASRRNKVRHLYFQIKQEEFEAIPQCNGIDIEVVQLPEYEMGANFCDLAQAQGSETYIFETIIEDIRSRVVEKPNVSIPIMVSSALSKWKEFFAKNREIFMSPERQQGLYGELRFLEEIIDGRGVKAVLNWTGCNFETHDFYIDSNAIEVKTTSTKAPYKMHISSEYQLDASEVHGKLFVKFYAFRKGKADGERLFNIVKRMREKLKENPHSLKLFNEKLEEYGYFDIVGDKYDTGYSDRVEAVFCVSDDFPRIVPEDLALGISCCTYDILVDQCANYKMDREQMRKLVEGENIND